jgi:hypothetical protein
MNDNYVKPSTHKQWREKTSAPIAARTLSKAEITYFHKILADSYQCDQNDIENYFQRILDDDDDDRDDCIWLKFRLKCFDTAGAIYWREIFAIKVLIPPTVKMRAEEHKRNRYSPAGTYNTSCPVTAGSLVPVNTGPHIPPSMRRPRARPK